MSFLRNLVPGQYQIGDLVFGRGTTVQVETFDPKPYDINSQDYQVSRADEMRFGWDQLKPTTIEITFHVLNNQLRPGFESLIPNFWDDMPKVRDFQREWKFDEGRYSWGAMKPLYRCGRDGITRAIYGRPGQFTFAEDTPYTESVQCLGEFRRADTISYGVIENVVDVSSGSATIHGTQGDAASWLKAFITGPAVNPTLTFTNLYNLPTVTPTTFQITRTVATGEVIEINAEPWSRRAVSSTGDSVNADLNEYLDKLRFYCEAEVEVTYSGGGECILLYRDGYQVL